LKLVHIAGDTYYIPGLTNVGVYGDYVVDPGKNEHVNWSNPRESFGRDFSIALITHGHNDHFWHAADMRSRGAKVYAPRGEMPMIEDISVHTNGFFMWTRPPDGMKPWYFRGMPCRVDGFVEETDMQVKAVPLPGHTDWHVGYMTPDGVLMAGDAIAGKNAWDTAGIVYHTNIPGVRRTLRDIIDMDAEWVLPSHAGPVTKGEAAELAEANLRGIDRLEKVISGSLDKKGVSIEDIVCRVCKALDMRDEFSVHLVAETTVRSLLHAMYEEGVVEYELKGHRVLWRVTR
jgi:glyoxylase-like metal-dependent hydrolase (beta-lactamase superfamily II)